MRAVLVIVQRKLFLGITHILQTFIHLGYIRIRISAGGACVKVNERSIIGKILLAEEDSPCRVVISPERRGESACCLGTFKFGVLRVGTFILGTFKFGVFKVGVLIEGTFKLGTFKFGVLMEGTFKLGTFKLGVLIEGTFKLGVLIEGTLTLGTLIVGVVIVGVILLRVGTFVVPKL